jgi:hypothetical protein
MKATIHKLSIQYASAVAFFEKHIIPKNMNAVLTREHAEPTQTLGKLELYDASGKRLFECKTLELPWLNNTKQKSCIPTGIYTVTARTSPKYGLHYLVNKVKNRDSILIHHGNYKTDILGCILVGSAHVDLNGDTCKDVTSSKATMKKLLKLAPDGFKLSIR